MAFLGDALQERPDARQSLAKSNTELLEDQEKEEKALIRAIELEEARLQKAKGSYTLLLKVLRRTEELEGHIVAHTSQVKHELQEGEEREKQMQQQIDSRMHDLEVMLRENTLNIVFHIWHDGHFGTINGFRLGRPASNPISWQEISTAWGQAALLLSTIANRSGFTFSKYRLCQWEAIPKIALVGRENTAYDLNTSSGSMFKRALGTFSSAMMAFLECLNEICLHMQAKQRSLHIPYTMCVKGKDIIDDVSIKLGAQTEGQWTRACKCVLINLKWLTSAQDL